MNLACIVMLRTSLLIHSSDFQMAEDMEQFQSPSKPTFQELQTYTAAQLQIFVQKFGLPTTVPNVKLLLTAHACILMGLEEKPSFERKTRANKVELLLDRCILCPPTQSCSQHRGADRSLHVQDVKKMSYHLSSSVLCVH